MTFVNGTSATSQNPQVQFNASGTYDVTLDATNGIGTSSSTQTAMINILSPSLPPMTEDFQAAAFLLPTGLLNNQILIIPGKNQL